MATTTSCSIEIKRLGRRKINELTRKAKRFGMTPEQYVRQLVDDDLELSRAAQSMTFAHLLGPGQEYDEKELLEIVERARNEHYKSTQKKKRR